jgi:predicted dehydrogenase
MDTLRIGVLGVGGRGTLAAYAHSEELCAKIVAGADPSPEARAQFEGRYGSGITVSDYRELLDRADVDAVFVCSPDPYHEEQAVAALEAGKAVYLEKPIAVTIEGADRVLETARRTGSKLYLGHNMRYFPAILKMKEILESGVIGTVQAVWCRHFVSIGGDAYFKDWHSERKNTTGLLLQKGAHDIDVIHWLAGGYAASVVAMGRLSVYDKAARRSSATGRRVSINAENWPPYSQTDYSVDIDIEDHSMMLFSLDNGIQCSYLQCHYAPDYWRNYTFIGDRGRIENYGDSGSCEIRVHTTRTNGAGSPDIVHYLKPSSGSHGGSDPAIVRSFVEFVRDGVIPNTSPVAARYAVAAGVMATESLRTDNALRSVPRLDPQLEAYFERGQTASAASR